MAVLHRNLYWFVLSIWVTCVVAKDTLKRKNYEGETCSSGSIYTTSKCGFGTACDSYSGKCVESLDRPHEWLRDPIDQGPCAASQVMAMVGTLDDRRSAYGLVDGGKLDKSQQTSVQLFLNCMGLGAKVCDGK